MLDLNKLQNDLGVKDVDLQLETKVEKIVIEDIAVVNAGRDNKMTVPGGYEKINVDLNEKAGGNYLYLCIKKGTDENRAINDLIVIEGKNASAPKGYEKIDIDLNKGAGGKYLYLCKRRGKDNPLTDIKVISSKEKNVTPPSGYSMIQRDLNEKAGGKYIYLCYKR